MILDQDTKGKKALVFFHHNPYPPKTGAHQRAIQLMKMLIVAGYQVSLFSSIYFPDTQWNEASLRGINQELGIETFLHRGNKEEFQRVVERNNRPIQGKSFVVPQSLQRDFGQVLAKVQPEVIVINYAFWSGLVENIDKGSKWLVDTHDLVTINQKMQNMLAPLVHPSRIQHTIEDKNLLSLITREDFFQYDKLTIEDWELAAYDKFDFALFIAEKEQNMVAPRLEHARSFHLPMTLDVTPMDNQYSCNPVFVIGPNYFNLQGYLFFAYKVLPLLVQRAPHFCLDVVGVGSQLIKEGIKGIRLVGAVPKLEQIYQQARYAICPLLGGTGQQVKIIEAMAYGIPVVVMSNVANSSPVEHGVNGFIAHNAKEFADFCYQLDADVNLCRIMGKKAREVMEKWYSPSYQAQRLVEEL